jgi:CTP:phosphocholine cytidylyltransferase-like protein
MSLREVLDSPYVLREINVMKKIGVLEEKDRYKIIIIIGSIGSDHETYFEENMVKIILEKSYLETMMKISLEEVENSLNRSFLY